MGEEYYNYIISSGRQINKTQYVREMGFISALTKNPPIDELNATHLNRIFEYSLIRQVKNKTARNKFTTIMRIYKFALARDYILDNKRFNIERAVNGLMAQYDKLLKKYKQKPVAPAAPVAAPVPVTSKPKDNLRLLKDLINSMSYIQKRVDDIDEAIDKMMEQRPAPRQSWWRGLFGL